MRGHVQDGRVVLDEPLDLPNGTRLRIVMEPEDAALEASIARGIADVRAGRVSDLEDFLVELGSDDPAASRGR